MVQRAPMRAVNQNNTDLSLASIALHLAVLRFFFCYVSLRRRLLNKVKNQMQTQTFKHHWTRNPNKTIVQTNNI